MGQEKLSKKKDFTGVLMCIKARSRAKVFILFCLLMAFSSFGFFENRKRRKKGKKMSKVTFLPYARFLAPSVKSMFRLRVCVTVYTCACTY